MTRVASLLTTEQQFTPLRSALGLNMHQEEVPRYTLATTSSAVCSGPNTALQSNLEGFQLITRLRSLRSLQ